MGASGSKSATLWKAVMEQTAIQDRKVKAELMAKVQSEVKETKAMPDKPAVMAMLEEANKQFDAENRAMLERVWKQYDVNGDGELDREECKNLVREMLNEQHKFAPKLINMMLDSSLDVSLGLLKAMALTEAQRKDAIKLVKAQMTEVKKEAHKAAAVVTSQLVKDYVAISAQLFVRMDSDGSGKVSKEEFFSNYGVATKEVVNIEEMIAQLQLDGGSSSAAPAAAAPAKH